MSEIRVTVRDTYLDAEAINVVSGAIGTVPCIFDFDESWDGYAKTVIFYQDKSLSQTVAMLAGETSCDTPFEVLLSAKPLYIGLFGTKDNQVKPTNWAIVKVPEGTYSADTVPPPPSPDIYIQLLNKIEQYRQDNSENAASAAASASAAVASASEAAAHAQEAQQSAENAASIVNDAVNIKDDVAALKESIETSEPQRVAAEQARVTAEQGRVAAESGRSSAELARVSAETARQNAETARVNAENTRVSAESDRASAESARQSAESARKNAETNRANAESARQAYFESLQPYLNSFIETIGIGVEYGCEVIPASPITSNAVYVTAGAAHMPDGRTFIIEGQQITFSGLSYGIVYIDSSGIVMELSGSYVGDPLPELPEGALLLAEVYINDGADPLDESRIFDKRIFTYGLHSYVKNKTFESIGARMNAIEEDAETLEARVAQAETGIDSLQTSIAGHDAEIDIIQDEVNALKDLSTVWYVGKAEDFVIGTIYNGVLDSNVTTCISTDHFFDIPKNTKKVIFKPYQEGVWKIRFSYFTNSGVFVLQEGYDFLKYSYVPENARKLRISVSRYEGQINVQNHPEDINSYPFDLGFELAAIDSINKKIDNVIEEVRGQMNASFITDKWIRGGLTDGNITSAVNRICTSPICYTKNDLNLVIKPGKRIGVHYYDSNGNYINETGWIGGYYTIPAGSYFRMVISGKYVTDSEESAIVPDFDEFLNYVKITTFNTVGTLSVYPFVKDTVCTEVFQANTSYRMQGGVINGNYLYYGMTANDIYAVIYRRNLTNGETISVTGNYGHAGDLTFNKKEDVLLVLNGTTSKTTIWKLHKDTLEQISEHVINTPGTRIGALAYNPKNCGYVAQFSKDGTWYNYTFVLLDSEFNPIYKFEPIKNGLLLEGIDCDGKFIYALYYSESDNKNIIIVYDLYGNYRGCHKLSISGEGEFVACYNEKNLYVSVDGSCKVYNVSRTYDWE